MKTVYEILDKLVKRKTLIKRDSFIKKYGQRMLYYMKQESYITMDLLQKIEVTPHGVKYLTFTNAKHVLGIKKVTNQVLKRLFYVSQNKTFTSKQLSQYTEDTVITTNNFLNKKRKLFSIDITQKAFVYSLKPIYKKKIDLVINNHKYFT